MVVVMKKGASEAQIESVVASLNSCGFDVHRSSGIQQTVLGAIGVRPDFDLRTIRVLDGVANVQRVTEPYKFASRSWKQEASTWDINGIEVGGPEVIIMAGPCAVESEEQMDSTAAAVAAHGATFLRGGAFKPRTSPYSFQGLGEEGLKLLRAAGDRHGLNVITEVTDVGKVAQVYRYTDAFQVGARNMQNFELLKELGRSDKPILLKRGMSATINEWLMAAEYIMCRGNQRVMLCERGIRTFESATRNTLDLSAIPVVKNKSHLPVLVDPSHATGIRDKVLPMARAAVASGADGIIVEVHPEPDKALSDGPQSLYFGQFAELVAQIREIAQVIGRTVRSAPVPTEA